MAHPDAYVDETDPPVLIPGTYNDTRTLDVWRFLHRKDKDVDVEVIIEEGGVDKYLTDLHEIAVRHAPDLVRSLAARMRAVGERPRDRTAPEQQGTTNPEAWRGWLPGGLATPTMPTPKKG